MKLGTEFSLAVIRLGVPFLLGIAASRLIKQFPTVPPLPLWILGGLLAIVFTLLYVKVIEPRIRKDPR